MIDRHVDVCLELLDDLRDLVRRFRFECSIKRQYHPEYRHEHCESCDPLVASPRLHLRAMLRRSHPHRPDQAIEVKGGVSAGADYLSENLRSGGRFVLQHLGDFVSQRLHLLPRQHAGEIEPRDLRPSPNLKPLGIAGDVAGAVLELEHRLSADVVHPGEIPSPTLRPVDLKGSRHGFPRTVDRAPTVGQDRTPWGRYSLTVFSGPQRIAAQRQGALDAVKTRKRIRR